LIKKLDILLIRSFIGPFIVTFFVSLFVLMMQFFWLYMDEMLGKGVGVTVLLQLLVYMSTTMVPLALPLAILLSSIMTFGNMGENFELVAIKSSGISLLRFMQPLFIFIFIISIFAFFFSNNVIPVANLKALSLLYDVRNSKPTLNIRPDQFNNDIQGYSIRIGSKDKDGKVIRDVIIYDHTDMVGNNKVVIAKEGEMLATADKQAMIFRLKDGWQYNEGYENGSHDYTQVRMHFDKWDKVFDMSGFKFTRTNEDMFKNATQMMNVAQLKESIDSIVKQRKRIAVNIHANITPYITLETKGKHEDRVREVMLKSDHKNRVFDSSFIELVPDSARKSLLLTVTNNLRNFKSLLDVSALEYRLHTENYLKYEIELHRKFTLSFACILLFLIGAPLGAIIRKGGLGMPLVIAVAFFVSFHILNISGEKLAKAASVAPWQGMWMSTFMLLPLAFWLIRAARNDSRIFTADLYLRVLRLAKTGISLIGKKK
jgi:lipopolysaccharide export system permease protein